MRIIYGYTKNEMQSILSEPFVPALEKDLALNVAEAQKFVWRYEAVVRELGKEKKKNV